MALLAVGLNHKTVPLGVLEQLALVPSELPKALARLLDEDGIGEGVILSTCNRIEVYAWVQRFHPAVGAVRRFLTEVSGVSQDVISGGLYTYYDDSAARHLFRVASGVDSMVVGEPQILGQVREAYRIASAAGAARRGLGPLFQRALRVGKRARTETAIGRHVVSIPQAAARLAGELAGGLRGRFVCVVGAGRIGELAARAALEAGAGRLVVANRSPERAARLAERLGVEWRGLEALPALLGEADVLLTTTASPEPILTRDAIAAAVGGRARPLVAVDVAVPRDIDPAARDLPGLRLRDLDDLRAIVESGTRERLRELPKVEAIVEEEVGAWCAWRRSLAVGPAIEALRARAEEIRAREVARAARRMGADEAGRRALDALTRSLVNKLLHAPIVRLKELAQSGDGGQVFLEAFQELFDLDAPAGE